MIIKPKKTKQIVGKLLNRAGLTYDNQTAKSYNIDRYRSPNLLLEDLIDVYKRFAKMKIDCSFEEINFSSGINSTSGNAFYEVNFTRDYWLHLANNHYKLSYLDYRIGYYPVTPDLICLTEQYISLNDFHSFGKYLLHIKNTPVYRALKTLRPFYLSIHFHYNGVFNTNKFI